MVEMKTSSAPSGKVINLVRLLFPKASPLGQCHQLSGNCRPKRLPLWGAKRGSVVNGTTVWFQSRTGTEPAGEKLSAEWLTDEVISA